MTSRVSQGNDEQQDRPDGMTIRSLETTFRQCLEEKFHVMGPVVSHKPFYNYYRPSLYQYTETQNVASMMNHVQKKEKRNRVLLTVRVVHLSCQE